MSYGNTENKINNENQYSKDCFFNYTNIKIKTLLRDKYYNYFKFILKSNATLLLKSGLFIVIIRSKL